MSEESSLNIADLLSLLSSDEADVSEKKEEDTPASPPLDMEMILKLGNIFSLMNQEDPRSRLLNDLKPFLSGDKKGKVDQAVQLLKLAGVFEKLNGENLL